MISPKLSFGALPDGKIDFCNLFEFFPIVTVRYMVTAKKHNNTKNHYNLTPLHSTEVAAGVEICKHLINSNFSLCAGQTKHKKEQHILKFIIDALLLLIKGSLNISASPTYTVRSISSLTLTQFYNFCLFTSPQMTTNETEVQIFIFKCNAIPHFQ